ncbi:hypothetical protein D1007_38703 [Hordeum vulgare]|nr:hypothetical protein D1007_38703 [Hordeum vulgare]
MAAATPDSGGVVSGYGDLPGLRDDDHVGMDQRVWFAEMWVANPTTSRRLTSGASGVSTPKRNIGDDTLVLNMLARACPSPLSEFVRQECDEQQCEEQQSDEQELSTIVYQEHVLFDLSETLVFAIDQHGVVFESQEEEEGYKYDVYEDSDGDLEMEEGKIQREQEVLEEEEESDDEPSKEEEALHYEGDTEVEEPLKVEEDNTLRSEEEEIINKKQRLPVRRGPTIRPHSSKLPEVEPDFKPSSYEEEKGLLEESDDDDVPKSMAYRAKNIVIEAILGDHKLQYPRLRDYAQPVMDINPRSRVIVTTVTPIQTEKIPHPGPRFHAMFFCINGGREAFLKGCTPFIGVDGCSIKLTTGAQFLAATGKDGNNNIYPLAFGIVGQEDTPSWCWFLHQLKICIGVNNLSEVFNKYILDVRRKPIRTMCDGIKDKQMVRWHRNRESGKKARWRITPHYSEKLEIEKERAKYCKPIQAGVNLWQVTSGQQTHVVNLELQTCGCRKWNLTGIPCNHAISTINKAKRLPEDFVSTFSKK